MQCPARWPKYPPLVIVDLKIYVEIVHYKGPHGSNMRPRGILFWVCESIFWANVLAKDFNMRPRRKINVGFAKDSRKYFFIREQWPFADKGI